MSVTDCPPDWTCLQWHLAPDSKRYHSRDNAARACRWLNSHEGDHDVWLFRPGPLVGGRVLLERRWIGRWEGIA